MFADELKVRDLYELPAMSYRYPDVGRLYTNSGRPRGAKWDCFCVIPICKPNLLSGNISFRMHKFLNCINKKSVYLL